MGVQTSNITTASGDLTIQPTSGQTLIKSVTADNPGVTPVAAASDGTVKKFAVTDLNTKATLDDADWVVVHDSATGNTVKVPGSEFGGGAAPTAIFAEEVGYDASIYGTKIVDSITGKSHSNIFTVGNTIYSSAHGQIFSTTDGYTWTGYASPTGSSAFGNSNYMGYDHYNSLFIYVPAGIGGVASKSSDLVSWTPMGSIAGQEHMFIDSSPTTGTMISSRKGGIQKIYRSTDQGANWTELGDGGDSSSKKKVFATANGNFFMEFQTELYRSTDDGLTWSQVATGASSTLGNQSYMRESSSGVLVYLNPSSTNTFGNPLYSTDDGASWNVVGNTLTGWAGADGTELFQNINWFGSAWYAYLYSRNTANWKPCLAFKSTDLQNWAFHAGVGASQRLRADLGGSDDIMVFNATSSSGTVSFDNYFRLRP